MRIFGGAADASAGGQTSCSDDSLDRGRVSNMLMPTNDRANIDSFARNFSRERLTVLVVDADADLGWRVQIRLRQEARDRAEVVRARSLADGLLAVAEQKIDVILLELDLPDRSGLETAITMVRGARAIPVVTVVRPETRELCLESLKFGVFGMIEKESIGARQLFPLFRWAIERHALCKPSEQRERENALRKTSLGAEPLPAARSRFKAAS